MSTRNLVAGTMMALALMFCGSRLPEVAAFDPASPPTFPLHFDVAKGALNFKARSAKVKERFADVFTFSNASSYSWASGGGLQDQLGLVLNGTYTTDRNPKNHLCVDDPADVANLVSIFETVFELAAGLDVTVTMSPVKNSVAVPKSLRVAKGRDQYLMTFTDADSGRTVRGTLKITFKGTGR